MDPNPQPDKSGKVHQKVYILDLDLPIHTVIRNVYLFKAFQKY